MARPKNTTTMDQAQTQAAVEAAAGLAAGAPLEVPPKPIDKIPVSAAKLHTAMMFGGVTHDHLNDAKWPGIQMLWVKGEGLLVSFKGNERVIPSAAIQWVDLTQKTNGRIVRD